MWGGVLSIGSIRTASSYKTSFVIEQKLRIPLSEQAHHKGEEPYLSSPRTLQLWASTLVVLPVFLQAPWVRLHPVSACLFTAILLFTGIFLTITPKGKWVLAGSLLVGVSGSWLGGCLFWGWLREYPIWHLPVEAIALPIALLGIKTRWSIGASFYLACLLGTACTDLMIFITGVMSQWPAVVKASINQAPELLNQTAQQLLELQSLTSLLVAGILIAYLASAMRKKGLVNQESGNTWLVASAALNTTLWIDGLFLLTALMAPRLSGLI